MNRIPRSCLTLIPVLGVLLSWPGTGSAEPDTVQADPPGVKTVFEQLKQLQGSWRGEGGVIGAEPGPVEHEFSVGAGGSIMVELMDPNGERELNVYHLVDDELLLMHFCGGATQPVLKLDTGAAKPGILPFVLAGGTNFDPTVDRHIHTSKLVLLGNSKIESWWTAEKAGNQVMQSRFVLERLPEP